MEVNRACKDWLFAHPPPLVESASDWQDRVKEFGFKNEGKKVMNTHCAVFQVHSQLVLMSS